MVARMRIRLMVNNSSNIIISPPSAPATAQCRITPRPPVRRQVKCAGILARYLPGLGGLRDVGRHPAFWCFWREHGLRTKGRPPGSGGARGSRKSGVGTTTNDTKHTKIHDPSSTVRDKFPRFTAVPSRMMKKGSRQFRRLRRLGRTPAVRQPGGCWQLEERPDFLPFAKRMVGS